MKLVITEIKYYHKPDSVTEGDIIRIIARIKLQIETFEESQGYWAMDESGTPSNIPLLMEREEMYNFLNELNWDWKVQSIPNTGNKEIEYKKLENHPWIIEFDTFDCKGIKAEVNFPKKTETELVLNKNGNIIYDILNKIVFNNNKFEKKIESIDKEFNNISNKI